MMALPSLLVVTNGECGAALVVRLKLGQQLINGILPALSTLQLQGRPAAMGSRRISRSASCTRLGGGQTSVRTSHCQPATADTQQWKNAHVCPDSKPVLQSHLPLNQHNSRCNTLLTHRCTQLQGLGRHLCCFLMVVLHVLHSTQGGRSGQQHTTYSGRWAGLVP